MGWAFVINIVLPPQNVRQYRILAIIHPITANERRWGGCGGDGCFSAPISAPEVPLHSKNRSQLHFNQ